MYLRVHWFLNDVMTVYIVYNMDRANFMCLISGTDSIAGQVCGRTVVKWFHGV